ncbi:MAG: hypothetical protein PVG71_12610 [Anaerolineae bacterium]|jgi:hypothetical protein
MTILNFGSLEEGAYRTRSEFGELPRGDERWIIVGGMAAIIFVALLCAMATYPPVVHSQTGSASSGIEIFADVGVSSSDDAHSGTEQEPLRSIQEADATVSWGDYAEEGAFGRSTLLALEEFRQRQDGYSGGSMAADAPFADAAHGDWTGR